MSKIRLMLRKWFGVAGGRTVDLRITGPTPYPLGHGNDANLMSLVVTVSRMKLP